VCGGPISLESLEDHMFECAARAYRAGAEAVLAAGPPPGVVPRLCGAPFASVVSAMDGAVPPPGTPNAAEILPGLWLGNTVAATDPAFLRRAGITGIVNCADDCAPLPAADLAAAGVHDGVVHLTRLIDNSDARSLASSVPELLRGAAAIARLSGDAPPLTDGEVAALLAAAPGAPAPGAPAGGAPAGGAGAAPAAAPRTVLVHCAMGRSRSASTLILYLMRSRGLPLAAALAVVKSRRPMAHPNAGFLAVLAEAEARLAPDAPPSVPHDVVMLHSTFLNRVDGNTGRPLPPPADRWRELRAAAASAMAEAWRAGGE
jgi:hypothetical protein